MLALYLRMRTTHAARTLVSISKCFEKPESYTPRADPAGVLVVPGPRRLRVTAALKDARRLAYSRDKLLHPLALAAITKVAQLWHPAQRAKTTRQLFLQQRRRHVELLHSGRCQRPCSSLARDHALRRGRHGRSAVLPHRVCGLTSLTRPNLRSMRPNVTCLPRFAKCIFHSLVLLPWYHTHHGNNYI